MKIDEKLLDSYYLKDEYISEILKTLNQEFQGKVVIKGGTAINKFWILGNRISEDVDLLLINDGFHKLIGDFVSYSSIQRKIKKLNKIMKEEVRSIINNIKWPDFIIKVEEEQDTERRFINRAQFNLYYNIDDFIKLEIGFLGNSEYIEKEIKDVKTGKSHGETFKVGSIINNTYDKLLILHRWNTIPGSFDKESTLSRHVYDLYNIIGNDELISQILSEKGVEKFVNNLFFVDTTYHRESDKLRSMLLSGINFENISKELVSDLQYSYIKYTEPMIYKNNEIDFVKMLNLVSEFIIKFNKLLISTIQEWGGKDIIESKFEDFKLKYSEGRWNE